VSVCAGALRALTVAFAQATTYELETLMLHGGQTTDPATGARAVPIYQSTSFAFHNTRHAAELFSLDEPGNVYTRMSNPTTDVFEKRIALLEGGVGALATSSGQAAAMITMLTLLQAGDEIVAASTLYGGTYHLLADTLPKFGIRTTFVNPDAPDNFRAAMTERTRCVYAETIGNPNLNVLDIAGVAAVARAHKVPLVLDCTFTTPYLCQAFKHGCNIVLHSATKWIGGHGTSIGGIIVDGGNFDWARSGKFPGFTAPDPSYNNIVFADDFGTLAFIQKVRHTGCAGVRMRVLRPGSRAGMHLSSVQARVQMMRDLGACISPFNSFLLLLGVETLHVRMREHCANALRVATFLSTHPAVAWVKYPGLATHASYANAQRYLKDGWYGAWPAGACGAASQLSRRLGRRASAGAVPLSSLASRAGGRRACV
jgi:O-acetylhomoserine (thiol)-lyase